jgi:hypothetical protein
LVNSIHACEITIELPSGRPVGESSGAEILAPVEPSGVPQDHAILGPGLRTRSGSKTVNSMAKHEAAGGALTIMMGSGAIADFELREFGSELFVRVWILQNCDASRVRKHVAALLPSHLEERHITVAEA